MGFWERGVERSCHGWPPAYTSVLCFVVSLLHAVLISYVRTAHSLSGASPTCGSVERGQVPSHLCPSRLQAYSSWLERTLCQDVQGAGQRQEEGLGWDISIIWASLRMDIFIRLEALHGCDFIRLLNALELEMFPGNAHLFVQS